MAVAAPNRSGDNERRLKMQWRLGQVEYRLELALKTIGEQPEQLRPVAAYPWIIELNIAS